MMDKTEFYKGGSSYIQELIDTAVSDGTRCATVAGNWEIEEAVRIPSDFTLILEDCHLRMADGVYSNMLVNEGLGTERGRMLSGEDRNIKIIGKGKAILDGGKYNGLSERNSEKDGMPPIWKNSILLFANVRGFSVTGIQCRNQRWWALNFLYCSDGYIGDVDFCASDIGVDADGNEYHGLIRDRYEEVLVKNADGIDLRCGCHNIIIENISGFTEDDTIALTALGGRIEEEYAVRDASSDIRNVIIRNIRSSAFCTNVRLLNQGGTRLYNISIDGVYDTSRDTDYFDRCLYAVRIGDVRMYGSRHATSDETYNISVRNIRGGGEYAVSLAGAMRNFAMSDVDAYPGTKLLLDERV